MNPYGIRILGVLLAPLFGLTAAGAADYLVYAGTYTERSSRGIYAYRFHASSGKLTPLGLAAATPNPSFLIAHPSNSFLYAVNEGGGAGDAVTAFAIDRRTGKLRLLNQVPSRGEAPCHLALDHTGRWLAVANYGNGTVALLPVQADGRLGEAAAVIQQRGSGANPERQKGPHAHCVVFSPDNRFLLTADLGADRIFVYRFDAAGGSLAPAEPPYAAVAAGAGVRHLVFHPDGRVLYAINEMASTVTAFGYAPATGALDELQTVSTLPAGFAGSTTAAEIEVNAAGTFLYASNRGHDSIALVALGPGGLALTPMEYAPTLGRTPRHFALDPTGGFLPAANQGSNSIVVFRVHPHTGQLIPAGRPVTDISSPSCIVFVPID